ncbi:MAG: glycerophosphodiester phosphodiesterase family protein [Bauldia sp.]
MSGAAWLTVRPIAHRGLHDASRGIVENTLGAAAAAAAAGYGVEVDIRLTADEGVAVFHDDTLDRLTTSAGSLARFTAAELRTVAIRESRERIPILEELLETIAGRVPLVLELKTVRGDRGRLVRRVLAAIEPYRGNVALMSFDAGAMALIAASPRAAPLGLVAASNATALAALARWRASQRALPHFLAFGATALPAWVAAAFRRQARPVLAWTVRSAAEAARLRPFVDQIVFEHFLPV